MPHWVLVLALLATGCSAASSPPSTAALEPTPDAPAPLLMAAKVTLEFDPEGVTGSLEPLERVGAAEPPLGTSALVDMGQYLRGRLACSDCLRLQGVSLFDQRTVDVTFSVAHPFKESSGRWDLHLFDVRGHLAGTRPSTAFPGIGIPRTGQGLVPARAERLLANADGYSSFFDTVAAPALGIDTGPVNLRGYRFFWKDLTNGTFSRSAPQGFTDIQNPSGHNVLPVGGAHTDPKARATYRIVFSGTLPQEVTLVLAVDAMYGKTAPNGAPGAAKYFLPLFNQPMPVVLGVTSRDNTLREGITASGITLTVKVGDWQAGAGPLVNPDDFDFISSPPDTIPYDGEPASIRIDLPTILNEPVALSPLSNIDGVGSPLDPYVYELRVTNQRGAAAGSHYGLVQVLDAVLGVADAQPLVVARDGRTLVDFDDFATYQLFRVQVAAP
ncbi:MAG TPA: hypothetical protein VEI97_15600 [bacterium]|nr:hypothetical protein [bacterium]